MEERRAVGESWMVRPRATRLRLRVEAVERKRVPVASL